ncbi:MAG: AI-2E family transporter [Moorellales bacterium]
MQWLRDPKKMVIGGLLAAVGLYFIYRVRAVLPPFIFALALTYLLHPPVNWLCRKGLPRTAAIVVVYAAVAAGLVLVSTFALPALVRESAAFVEGLPRQLGAAEEFLENLSRRYRRTPLPEGVRLVIDEHLRRGEQVLLNLLRAGTQTLIGWISQLANLVLAPILAFFFLQDAGGLTRRIRTYVPAAYQEQVLSVLAEIDVVLRNFVFGRLIVGLMVGVLCALGLAVIGVDYALVLGVIAGACDLIPFFGPFLGALPAVVLAGLESLRTLMLTVLLFLVVQQVEAQLLSPLILGESVGLHPVVIIFALLAGGYLYGLWGVLLAVPVAAVLRLVLRRLLFPSRAGN